METKNVILAACCLLAMGGNAVADCQFKIGDNLPMHMFTCALQDSDAGYLGLPKIFSQKIGFAKAYSFALNDIKADLIILEFLNVYCNSCQAQAPIMNQVYKRLADDKTLSDRVRIIGVCPGNNAREIEKFKNKMRIPFPLIPDPDFSAYEDYSSECGTPLLMLIRKDAQNRCVIVWSHIGIISSPLYFIQEAFDALNTDLASVVKHFRQKRNVKVVVDKPDAFISDETMVDLVKKTLEDRGLSISLIQKVAREDNELLFNFEINAKPKPRQLFAKLISRASVCDICHAVHFILVFDKHGIITDLIPLQFTKHGNVPWNEQEIAKTRKLLIGRSILKPIPFDPESDAVSSATMSSALIFNSAERTQRDFNALQKLGYISP